MVDDVAAAVAFYKTNLGFALESNAGTAFASVTRGPQRLPRSGPASAAGRLEASPGRSSQPSRMQ